MTRATRRRVALALCTPLLLVGCVTSGNLPPPPTTNDTDIAVLGALDARQGAPQATGQPPMDAAQLRQCAQQVLLIDAEQGALRGTWDALERRRGALQARSATLEAERGRVNVSQPAAVQAFNAAVAQLEAERVALNQEIDRHNVRAAGVNDYVRSYNGGCAQKTFRRSDLAQLPPEMVSALNARATPAAAPGLPAPRQPAP